MALLVLTVTTVCCRRYLHWSSVGGRRWRWGSPSVKTLLVVLFFMHLIHSRAADVADHGVGVLFLFAMISLTLSDYWTRGWMPVRTLPPGWLWV